MKKYLLILPIIIFSFLILTPVDVYATSGACSWHGGVNCSAGASSTGKVKCNDGSTNSSVYFSDMEECKQESSCKSLLPQHYGCDVERAKKEAQESANRINNNNNLIYFRSGMLPPLVDWTQDPFYLSCKNSQALYDIEMNIYNICISNEFKSPINNSTDIKMQDYCVGNHGNNVTYNSTKIICDCNFGYIFDENRQCSPEKEVLSNFCKKSYGQNSITSPIDKNKCSCSNGYSYDDTLKTCKILEVKKEIIQPVAVKKEPVNNPKKPNTIFSPKKLKATEKEIPKKPVNIPSTMQSIQPTGTVISNNGLLNNNDGINNMKSRLETNTTTQPSPEPVKKAPWHKRIFNWLFD